jgi:hypothetical protein
MTVAVSAALLFCLALGATIKWAAHKAGHALVAFLAGFFVAGTAAAPVIRGIITSLAHLLTNM